VGLFGSSQVRTSFEEIYATSGKLAGLMMRLVNLPDEPGSAEVARAVKSQIASLTARLMALCRDIRELARSELQPPSA